MFNGTTGHIVKVVYRPDGSPQRGSEIAYVLFRVPGLRLPSGDVWDEDDPEVVPIPMVSVRCENDCCSMRTIPIRVHKATSIHKAQGMTIGEGQPFQKVVVGLCGLCCKMCGSELVALSRAMEMGDLALWEDIPITVKYLLELGKGAASDGKRLFEQGLADLQSQTAPGLIDRVASNDNGPGPKTFAGGWVSLLRWYFEKVEATPDLAGSTLKEWLDGARHTAATALREFNEAEALRKATGPAVSPVQKSEPTRGAETGKKRAKPPKKKTGAAATPRKGKAPLGKDGEYSVVTPVAGQRKKKLGLGQATMTVSKRRKMAPKKNGGAAEVTSRRAQTVREGGAMSAEALVLLAGRGSTDMHTRLLASAVQGARCIDAYNSASVSAVRIAELRATARSGGLGQLCGPVWFRNSCALDALSMALTHVCRLKDVVPGATGKFQRLLNELLGADTLQDFGGNCAKFQCQAMIGSRYPCADGVVFGSTVSFEAVIRGLLSVTVPFLAILKGSAVLLPCHPPAHVQKHI